MVQGREIARWKGCKGIRLGSIRDALVGLRTAAGWHTVESH